MNSNTHSTRELPERADGLAALAAALDELAAHDLDGLPDTVRAERVLGLRRLVDRLEGHWLKELAGVDARGAAGAEQDQEAGSTAAWLRCRLRLGAGAAASAVRTARALFCGPLAATAVALTNGELSPAHAAVLAHGTADLPDHLTAAAEPVLVEAARRLDPPGSGRSWGICGWSPTPMAPTMTMTGVISAGGCGWPQPSRAWSPWTGSWTPKPARPSWPPWNPWPARPTPATPQRPPTHRRRPHRAGPPQPGPRAAPAVRRDATPADGHRRPGRLLGHPSAIGGEVGGAGPLDPEACRRLAVMGGDPGPGHPPPWPAPPPQRR